MILLGLLHFLLAFVRIVIILVGKDVLKLLAYFVLESRLNLVVTPVHQVRSHPNIVVSVDLIVGTIHLLRHFDGTVLIKVQVVLERVHICINPLKELWLGGNIRHCAFKLISWLELIFLVLTFGVEHLFI